ncbi:MAG: anti-sigma factor [Bacteroidales bacterium]|nr:anti-sigma factor [Bacteroidales bacterium]MCF8402296.1 anti-sigma factor [Bacteroidales bacterium]
MKKQLILLLLVPVMIFTACTKDENDDMNTPTSGELKLNLTNLMASASDEQYEGWIIVNGTPKSTGTFTVDASGMLSKTTFMVNATDLSAATDFVLSIEPSPDNDPAPSAIKIIGGSFSGSNASVSAAHGAALGNDFSSISGKFIFATPTTSTMDDELSGIWFLDLSSGSPMTGLDLPVLPAGWKYEGWTVINGTPVTSGTFSMVDAADDAAPYSGSDAGGPPFPGEDYVANAPAGQSFPTNLSGATGVISIEPDPDNSPDPFVFKPLVGTAPANAQDHVTYDMMSNVAGSFPSGTVSR